jgi:diguanylate cyclase (GGDEF)-like protein
MGKKRQEFLVSWRKTFLTNCKVVNRMFRTYPADLIKAVVDTLPAALLLVNYDRQVQEIFISKHRHRYFHERELSVLLRKFLMPETVGQIVSQFEQAVKFQQSGNVRRIRFQTIHGLDEYAACRVTPLPHQQGVAIVFLNESETALLEQEFQLLTEQAEVAQRELCDAMSAMDFRLMDLDQSHKRLQVLYEVASIVQRNISEQEVLEDIIKIVMSEFACVHAAIFLLNDTGDTLIMKAQRGYLNNLEIPLDSGIIGYAARTREQVFVPDVSRDSRYIPGTPDCVSELAIPLIVRDRVIGVLDLECPAERSLSPYDVEMLRTMAAQAAVVIAHIQHIALIEKVAITDELTGLYNYHHFRTLLEQEYRRACRYHHSLSLLMIDIDNFKHFNDSYGHLAGNEILAQVARLISQACRDVDWVCRYGGEEFAVLLPETNLIEAQIIAERVRQIVAEYSFQEIIGCCTSPRIIISISIGVASLTAGVANEKHLVAQADLALFAAKRSMKNCVRVYSATTMEVKVGEA